MKEREIKKRKGFSPRHCSQQYRKQKSIAKNHINTLDKPRNLPV